MTLIDSSTPAERVKRLAGNKAASLHALGHHGAPVPPWVALGADTFARFGEESGTGARIAALLAEYSPENAATIAEAIRNLVTEGEPGSALRGLVAEALERLGSGPLAVRSSGVEEDSAEFSFAGQFDTVLGVEGETAVVEAVRRCWASAYSERSLRYRHQHGLGFGGVEMAVVIQRLVDAETSGVVFTANPSNASAEELVVSSVYGLGEGLVSGHVDADTFVVERSTLATRSTVIGEKAERFDRQGVSPVPEKLREVASLDQPFLERLCRTALSLESAFARHLDIEWCAAGGQLWIVQARPITTPIVPSEGEARIWDNSNIVENYPGVSSPLTFTFTRHAYSRVFREFCQLLGVPPHCLKQMDEFLPSVLGSLNGRIYYNLLHWYKLSGLAPFADTGRKMMELQMGVEERLDLQDFAAKIRAFEPRSALEGRWIRFVTAANFARFFFGLERDVQRFRRTFQASFERYDGLDFARMPADEVYQHYCRFEREMIGHWARMIALESSIGLSYGLLRALCRRFVPDAPEWFLVAVIGNVEGLESAEPAARLREIARAVERRGLREALLAMPSDGAFEELARRGESEIVAQVQRYIDDFGYRANNELKLEEPDLRDRPGVLFDMLKASLAGGDVPAGGDDAAERILEERLNGWQRFVFERVRTRVRGAIRARETVRFCRSRAFGVIRRMFRAIGARFTESGLLSAPSEVFQLRLEELKGCFEGVVSGDELGPLVKQRLADQARYAAMEPLPSRFVTRGPVAAWLSNPAAVAAARARAARVSSDGALRGASCSPGVAEGVAKVVEEPFQFDGGVLVTYRTDPGWVPVFGAAQALLIERGSPLTHAAIVARELGLPTVVQIPGLTATVKSGMRLRVDGARGEITILEGAEAA